MKFSEWFTYTGDAELGAKIKAAIDFRMTDVEREDTRTTLLKYMRMKPYRARIRAKHSRFSYIFNPLPAFAFVMAVVVIGGSTATAAESALPGDLFYPVKVSVTEPIRGALAVSQEAKAEWAITRAERRVSEITVLESRGNVDETTRASVDARLDEQVQVAEEKTSEIENGKKEGVREQRLVALLRAHETLIADIAVGGTFETGELPPVEVAATLAMDSAATEAPEVALMAAIPEAQPTPVTTQMRTTETPQLAKKESAPVQESTVSEKTVKRQRSAAENRIKSLEKLVESKSRRIKGEHIDAARAELIAAQELFASGKDAQSEKDFLLASSSFNTAVRIAIDARESLARVVEPQKKSNESRRQKTNRTDESASDSENNSTDSERINSNDDEHEYNENTKNESSNSSGNDSKPEDEQRSSNSGPSGTSGWIKSKLNINLDL